MNKKVIEKVKTAESSISLVLGIIVVAVAGILLYNYFKGIKQNKTTEETQEEETTEVTQIPAPDEEGIPSFSGELPINYTVVKEDSLWTISEKFFGYGYNWIDIKEENNLTNPEILAEGQVLVIPNIAPRKPLTVIANEGTASPIESDSYVVQKGDSLWGISVRAYQDGYKWTEISKANNLENPNIIHPGNTLVIPR